MILFRKLLFPFAILYGIVSGVRNLLYDKGILKSHFFPVPVIAVGNLSVGGTGKSPQIEYLIRLLSDQYKVATLSRGYKRKSKGFILADENATAETLGDEPFQFYTKFKQIQVAVDADRTNGIQKLLSHAEKPEVILLDDAFQHRKVKAGFYILLTSYGDLYTDDFMLPSGSLREGRSGAKRANVIIVTKCPASLSADEQQKIRRKINPSPNQDLFFSFIEYDEFVYGENERFPVSEVKPENKILIAGIAKPEPFFQYLQESEDEVMIFPDHHNFTMEELISIENKTQNKKIITTEKDFMRLKDSILKEKLFYLPIKSAFISNRETFDQIILNYVGKSTTDR